MVVTSSNRSRPMLGGPTLAQPASRSVLTPIHPKAALIRFFRAAKACDSIAAYRHERWVTTAQLWSMPGWGGTVRARPFHASIPHPGMAFEELLFALLRNTQMGPDTTSKNVGRTP
jgi:hypothetical protein